MNHVIYPLSFADISIFSLDIRKLCYLKKYRYRLHFNTWFITLLTFFESLKMVSINMVTILLILTKMATLGLLKIQVFWNTIHSKYYVHDVTNRILSRDSNYIVDVVIWTRFGNSSTSMREVIITWIL